MKLAHAAARWCLLLVSEKRLPAALLHAAVLFVAFGIGACHTGSSGPDANAAAIPSAQVVAAQRGDISHVLTLAGQFQPYQVVDVHPKVSGYMARINVDIGDVVHKGDTLAVLEVPELKAELQQTVFALQQSNEEIVRAQNEISRAEATHAALHSQFGATEAGCGDTTWTDCAAGTG